MTTWTSPQTWTVAELATAAKLNLNMRDNVNYLFEHAPVTLFDGAPNSSSAYSIDLSTGEALNCKHLRGWAMLRSALAAVTNDIPYMLFNGDTTAANYRFSANAVTEAAANVPLGGNTPRLASMTGAGSPTGEFAFVEFEIPNFLSTTFVKKVFYKMSFYFAAGASFQSMFGGMHWNSAVAITSLQIRTDNHPTDTLHASSNLTLLGVKV